MLADVSLWVLLVAFAAAALAVVICGLRMTGDADMLADKTGLGEALVGGILLGMATSLSGVVVSVSAAIDARPALAFSNAIGGIAAQTAFLALADLLYRKANLEHAAADLANVFQAALLATMLAVPVAAYAGPDVAVFGVHPVSILLPIAYVAGLRAAARVREAPMWHPVVTRETHEDAEDEAHQDVSMRRLLLRFGGMVVVLAIAGLVISKTGGEMADRYGISETTMGALMTAVATSLPELITTLAAVRRGALQLAVGGIIGGNAFDTLFLTASDVAYRDGSLYHAIGPGDIFWVAVGMLMTGVLLLGLIAREKHGPGRIGTESLVTLGIYATAILVTTL